MILAYAVSSIAILIEYKKPFCSLNYWLEKDAKPLNSSISRSMSGYGFVAIPPFFYHC